MGLPGPKDVGGSKKGKAARIHTWGQRMHPRASARPSMSEATQTRVAGDLSVLKTHFHLTYERGRNGAPATLEWKRKDNFYRPVCLLSFMLTLTTFALSMHYFQTIILPASIQIHLKDATCRVQNFAVVDSLGFTEVPAESITGYVEPLKCSYFCEGWDTSCVVGKYNRGYGFCVQLNVSFEVTETVTVKESSLLAAQSSDATCTNGTSNGSSSSDCGAVVSPSPPPPGEVDADVDELQTRNVSAPVTIGTVTLGQDMAAAYTADAMRVIYLVPDYYPGYSDTPEALEAEYQRHSDGTVPPPHNKSYILPNFKKCKESDGYQCIDDSKTADNQLVVDTTCSLVDCRATEAEAIAALNVLEKVYVDGFSFPCEYMPPNYADAAMFKNVLGTPGAATFTKDAYPVFVTRTRTLAELVAFTVGIALFLCFCYGGCYFLCCREWWCEHASFQKFQYF